MPPPANLFESKKRPRGVACPKPTVHHGYYASGDSVLGAVIFANEVRNLARDEYEIDPAAIEMEGAGIAMACLSSGTRFILVKGIMDFCENKGDDWQQCAATVSLASIFHWAESLTGHDLTALHVRDLPPFKSDPYQRASELARLGGSMLPPRGVALGDVTKGESVHSLTKHDLTVEKFMHDGLCADGKSGFVGEANKEYSADRKGIDIAKGKWWIVDAVDGSENLIAARPEVAMSVAHYQDSKPILGLIHLPYRGLTVATTPVDKLLVNGVPWARRRAPARSLEEAVIALPGDMSRLRGTGLESVFKEFLSKTKAIRITGALAYDLACIALGEVDARISTSAEVVDVAAGVALVEATGGRLTDWEGNEWTLKKGAILAAATCELHTEILNLVKAARGVAL